MSKRTPLAVTLEQLDTRSGHQCWLHLNMSVHPESTSTDPTAVQQRMRMNLTLDYTSSVMCCVSGVSER